MPRAVRRVKVLVFDIDGTLTRTNRIDGVHFAGAVRAVLPDAVIDSFDTFPEMTDSAILRAVCERTGSGAFDDVVHEVQEHFLRGLTAAAEHEPGSFSAVPGARAVFEAARGAGWTPAIATGGWRPTAEFKLEVAGIPARRVPSATSSEAERRVDILRLAVARAAGGDASEVVYVGDGAWDVAACRRLGVGFIGRGEGADAERLLALGARLVVADFSDPAVLLAPLHDGRDLRPEGA